MHEYGKWDLVEIRKKIDYRGTLIYSETPIDVPFDIRRVYVLTNFLGLQERGNHAHRNLKQFMFALGGPFTINLCNGDVEETITLRPEDKALYIRGLVWRSIVPQASNSTLVVLASEIFSEEDYIRDFNEFRSIVYKRQSDGKNL
jgi:hypothetical protein